MQCSIPRSVTCLCSVMRHGPQAGSDASSALGFYAEATERCHMDNTRHISLELSDCNVISTCVQVAACLKRGVRGGSGVGRHSAGGSEEPCSSVVFRS